MKELRITVPEIAMVAGTRAALGVGIGLLLANRLTLEERKAIGWTLVAVGALTTIPLVLEVFGHARSFDDVPSPSNGAGRATFPARRAHLSEMAVD